MSTDLILGLSAALALASLLGASKLTRTIVIDIIRRPLTRTRIEIRDKDKKDITVKVA